MITKKETAKLIELFYDSLDSYPCDMCEYDCQTGVDLCPLAILYHEFTGKEPAQWRLGQFWKGVN